MYSGSRLRIVTGTVVIALAAGLGSAACGKDRWCEFDATDTKVANSYCENATPGYEWEPDSDGKHNNSKKKPTTPKRPTH